MPPLTITPHPCQAWTTGLFEELCVNDSSPLYCCVKPKVQLYEGFGTSACASTHGCVPLVAVFGISLWFRWSFQVWTLNPLWGLKDETIKWSSLSLWFCCTTTALLSKEKKSSWHQLTFNGRLMIDHTSSKDIKVFCFIWTPSDWDKKVFQTVCVCTRLSLCIALSLDGVCGAGGTGGGPHMASRKLAKGIF